MFFNKKKLVGIPFFLEVQEKLIQSIKNDIEEWQTTTQFSERKVYPVFVLFNSFVFYRLSFLDIAVLFKSFLSSKEEIEKKVYAKILAQNVYEFIEDLPRIFGKEFSNSLVFLRNDKLNEEVKSIRKEIHKIKLEHHEYLKKIRNSITAHKDHNTTTQIDVLETLSVDQIELICIKIYGLFMIINSFENRLIKATMESNKERVLKKKNDSLH